MMKADYLERVRRYSFFITVLISIFIVFKFLPASDERYLTLSLNGIRGIYNSAWVGSAIATLASMLLSLPAFFLVKNAIERDVQTGVGQIIATTPLTRWMYIMGKMWSNFVLLMSMVAVLIVSALAMQLIRGEDYSVDVADLVLPFLFSTLPTMALVASVAILFESVPFLSRGLGNLVYFILWGFSIKLSTAAAHPSEDVLGLSPILKQLSSQAVERSPQHQGHHISGISPLKGELVTYDWNGIPWTIGMFLERYSWLAAALVIAALASLFFHRFDLMRAAPASKKARARKAAKEEPMAQPVIVGNEATIKLTPYTHSPGRSRPALTLLMELRLMLKGLPLWWYLIALILIILGLVLPVGIVTEVVLPFTWLWPVLIWSAMGTNETSYRTHQLIFTAMHPVRNQFIVLWLGGVIVAYLTGSGAMVHFAVTGEGERLAAMAVGGLFIPTLAAALGMWTGNGKLFQLIYMLMWYLGPLNKWGVVDFMGASTQSLEQGVFLYYLPVTIILLIIALLGRVHQIKRYH
ncbi:ABC transporter permease [Paenibacillus albidus]|nr:hypothetical protein [Paenibacillus albidus]